MLLKCSYKAKVCSNVLLGPIMLNYDVTNMGHFTENFLIRKTTGMLSISHLVNWKNYVIMYH